MLPDERTIKTEHRQAKRTVTQDIRATIVLGLGGGALVGILAGVLGILAYLFWPSWIPAILIFLLALSLLTRQMIHRLNRVYLDHQVTSRGDTLLLGAIAAVPLIISYIYSSTATSGLYAAVTLHAPVATALSVTLCGPFTLILTTIQTREVTTIVSWLILSAWLLIRGCTYRPSLTFLTRAQRHQS